MTKYGRRTRRQFMFSFKRVFVALILTVGLLPMTSIAREVAAPRHCARTFTVRRAERAARVAWADTRTPSARDWRALFYFVRCQRNLAARPYVHWYYQHQAKLNSQRRWEAAHPIQYAVASWYDDAGSTACGFHAYYGVANKTLACGTQVTFYYGGHQVTAVVDDRGPYVWPRVWDLNQNTAGAVGFTGVDSVGYRIR